MATSMPLNPTSLPGRGLSDDVRMKTPLLHFGLSLKSSVRTKSSHWSLWTNMYPPDLCGLMAPSWTGVRLGCPLLVIQPSRVLPSNRSRQPSAFSFGVSSLSAAGRPEADTRKTHVPIRVLIEVVRGFGPVAVADQKTT